MALIPADFDSSEGRGTVKNNDLSKYPNTRLPGCHECIPLRKSQ